MLRTFAAMVMTALAIGVSPAQAHFVWIETDDSGSQTLVRSGFGEPGGWDPEYIDRLNPCHYWLRTAAGIKPVKLELDKESQEFRAKLSEERPSAVLAACDFNVFQMGGNPPSWLRYTAKNLVGDPKHWNDTQATPDVRIEVLAAREGDNVQLQVVYLGKPLPGATITAYPPEGEKVELKTVDQGRATWPITGPGLYSCYVGATVVEQGEQGGKKYELLKDYTTLTFTIPK